MQKESLQKEKDRGKQKKRVRMSRCMIHKECVTLLKDTTLISSLVSVSPRNPAKPLRVSCEEQQNSSAISTVTTLEYSHVALQCVQQSANVKLLKQKCFQCGKSNDKEYKSVYKCLLLTFNIGSKQLPTNILCA